MEWSVDTGETVEQSSGEERPQTCVHWQPLVSTSSDQLRLSTRKHVKTILNKIFTLQININQTVKKTIEHFQNSVIRQPK